MRLLLLCRVFRNKKVEKIKIPKTGIFFIEGKPACASLRGRSRPAGREAGLLAVAEYVVVAVVSWGRTVVSCAGQDQPGRGKMIKPRGGGSVAHRAHHEEKKKQCQSECAHHGYDLRFVPHWPFLWPTPDPTSSLSFCQESKQQKIEYNSIFWLYIVYIFITSTSV